jgi:hypothetical protein
MPALQGGCRECFAPPARCVVVAPDRSTRRVGALKLAAGAIAVALASLGTVAASSARSHGTGHVRASQPQVHSIIVGPQGTAAATAPSATPAATGGASQVVSGVVQSTNGVQLSSTGRPSYYGTEPATMTLVRRTHELIVTVAPR